MEKDWQWKKIVMMEKDCDDGEILWSWRNIVSSIVIEVIRVISNLFIFLNFFTKRFYKHKKHKKNKKHKNFKCQVIFTFTCKKNRKHKNVKSQATFTFTCKKNKKHKTSNARRFSLLHVKGIKSTKTSNARRFSLLRVKRIKSMKSIKMLNKQTKTKKSAFYVHNND